MDDTGLELWVRRLPYEWAAFVGENFDAIFNPSRLLFHAGEIAYPNSLVVAMAVISQDDWLLLGQRTSDVRFHENCWAITYEEHVRLDRDGCDPFMAAANGLAEELIGEDESVRSRTQAVFCSVARELDQWVNRARKMRFHVLNVLLVGLVKVPLNVSEIFRRWNDYDRDHEFQELAAVPYDKEYLWRLLTAENFNPAEWRDCIIVPEGRNSGFPRLVKDPEQRRWHPGTKIRLVCALRKDFRDFLLQMYRSSQASEETS